MRMLLDPFEEQLDLPSTFVEVGDGEGFRGKIVGEEDQPFSGLRIVEPDPPERPLEGMV